MQVYQDRWFKWYWKFCINIFCLYIDMFDSVSSRANLQEYFSSPQLSLVYYFSDNLDHKKYLIVIHTSSSAVYQKTLLWIKLVYNNYNGLELSPSSNSCFQRVLKKEIFVKLTIKEVKSVQPIHDQTSGWSFLTAGGYHKLRWCQSIVYAVVGGVISLHFWVFIPITANSYVLFLSLLIWK